MIRPTNASGVAVSNGVKVVKTSYRRVRGSRRLCRAILAAGVLGAVAAGAVGLSASDENVAEGQVTPPASPTVRQLPIEPTSPAETAPDGGVVRVVDTGLTAYKYRGDQMVTFGIVVENTSKEYLATEVSLSIQFVDVAGRVIKVDGEKKLSGEVEFVLPASRGAEGGVVSAQKAGIATAIVEFKEATWYPARTADYEYKALTAGGIEIVRGDDEDSPDAWANIVYTVDSDDVVMLNDHATIVIFRNGAGRIVGSSPSRSSTFAAAADGYATGTNSMLNNPMPPAVDGSRTEVHLPPQQVLVQ